MEFGEEEGWECDCASCRERERLWTLMEMLCTASGVDAVVRYIHIIGNIEWCIRPTGVTGEGEMGEVVLKMSHVRRRQRLCLARRRWQQIQFQTLNTVTHKIIHYSRHN